jgi:hypothetical protein
VDSGEGGHEGGHSTQDATKYCFHLPNGITLDAPYGHANLPVLPLSTGSDTEVGFGARCFAAATTDKAVWTRSILDTGNTNLTPAQKELLLWHQGLSHVSISTIHNLLHVKKTPSVCSPDELVSLCHVTFSPVDSAPLAVSLSDSCALHVKLLRLNVGVPWSALWVAICFPQGRPYPSQRL